MFTPEKEEKILAFWEKERIFEKSVEARRKRGKRFVFYEGPPTANGKPGIHHVLARSFKDVILRYKTMRGFFAPRRAGWDTHGLPVELEVEKELGLNSKKEIEAYGIEKFTKKAKENIWRYKKEWEELTSRMGFWIDTDNPYTTYETSYIESLWFIIKQFYEKGFFYEDFRVSPWCYRCGTVLSSHELAQGYKKTKDLSVFVKFNVQRSTLKVTVKNSKLDTVEPTYILSWTTTPWTLPGNVALAVGNDIDYSIVRDKANNECFILATKRSKILNEPYEVLKELKGKELVGLSYKQLFPVAELQNEKSHKIYAADFVNTDEGTGVVHTSVMYGEDDYKLGTRVGLPKFHTVTEEGRFIDALGEGLGGMPVKAKETEEKIIAYLEKNNALFHRGLYEHDYPFCWRCKTPLLYYATKSWFVKVTAVKDALIKNNSNINWVPEHLKNGRFGNFLEEVKDWAFSRRRYWGTPLPIWRCGKCDAVELIGSLSELQAKAVNNNTTFFLLRHAKAQHNLKGIVTCDPFQYDLTPEGENQAKDLARALQKEKIDIIIASPLVRARRTAEIIANVTGANVILDERFRELDFGPFEGKPIKEYEEYWGSHSDRFTKTPEPGMENFHDIRKRLLEALWDSEAKFKGKRVAIVTHQGCLWVLEGAMRGLSDREIANQLPDDFALGEIRKMLISGLPHNDENEIDLHRPFIDSVQLVCKNCKSSMRRVEDIADVWFDSGAMPFAKVHWPFAQVKSENLKVKSLGKLDFPADYICEAIDQTRGWFYTLLVIATLLGFESPYKNVISLGHLLDEQGRKMSKSLGNIIDPFEAMEQYGADAIRWYFFVVNPPGFYKRFDSKEILSHQRGFLLTLFNCANFLKLYQAKLESDFAQDKISKILSQQPKGNLDRWIRSRLHETIRDVTNLLDGYDITQAGRKLEELVSDLSNWYIRRSRKRSQVEFVIAELYFAISSFARMMAPFTPFSAEIIWQEYLSDFGWIEKRAQSVHLTDWPRAKEEYIDAPLHEKMQEIREVASRALAERAKNNIPVRQILHSFTITKNFPEDLKNLIREEVNVEEIIIGKEEKLNADIDQGLLKAGRLREFSRHVQISRKKRGHSPADLVELRISLTPKTKRFIEENQNSLKENLGLSDITFHENMDGETFTLEGEKVTIDT